VLAGGDCSITASAVAGCLAQRPATGVLYLDGDADLRTPQTTIAGNFDGMVIAALLGEGDPGYVGLAGPVPMVPPERLAILGYDDTDINPRERHLLGRPLSHADGKHVAADPVGAAVAARRHVEASATAIMVHFDVDAFDSAGLPLANYPHHGKGLTFDAAMTVLAELCASPAFAGLVLTEVNPTHDPGGELLSRYIDGRRRSPCRTLIAAGDRDQCLRSLRQDTWPNPLIYQTLTKDCEHLIRGERNVHRDPWVRAAVTLRRPGARRLPYRRERANTDSGRSCTSRSILEPEAPPEAPKV
jgi:arginase